MSAATDRMSPKVGRLTGPFRKEKVMKFTIKTEGLHCGHCDAAVESALLKVEHVTDADADHETNVVIVECSEVVAPEDLIARRRRRRRGLQGHRHSGGVSP